MFRPLPMKRALIYLLIDDLPQAALTLATLGIFNPESSERLIDDFPEVPGDAYRDHYHQARSRLDKIRRHIDIAAIGHLESLHPVEDSELQQTNVWLGEVWDRCSAYEEHVRRLADETHMIDQLEQTLSNFAALNIDLTLLQGDRRFLDLHIGMLPRDNLPPLREAIGLSGYLLFSYSENTSHAHVIIVGPKGERERELASVLDTAGFRELEIPPELHDKPDKIRQELQVRREALHNEMAQRSAAMAETGDRLRARLEQSRDRLIMAEPLVALDGAVRNQGPLAVISGWVASRDVDRLEDALRQALPNPVQITTTLPSSREFRKVPTCLPVNWFTSPFSTLIKQYGIPRYGEINPTLVFALSFIAMFGMMFGDIGHGLVIMLAAWLGRKKLKSFTPFVISAGLSTSLFGLLYGSLFGYEHLVPSLWLSPLTDPLYMLRMALFWGIGFLVIISLLSIHNRLVFREISHALFDTNGVASITLYLSVLAGLFNLYQSDNFGLLPATLSLITLFTLLGFKLTESTAPAVERMLVAVIETFETLTGYIANTLSFLRVAAFSLNHVALAIAVFTLADMLEGAGHWLVVIGGNLFILILEGAIVTIQALRLEYYEGFSRFYSGDGKEFKPLTLSLEER